MKKFMLIFATMLLSPTQTTQASAPFICALRQKCAQERIRAFEKARQQEQNSQDSIAPNKNVSPSCNNLRILQEAK